MRAEAGTVTPKAIRDALDAYLRECEESGEEPESETYRLYALLEQRAGLALDGLNPWVRARAQERFRVQVLRQLNLMAGNGTLVKRGERRDLRFYTPAAAKAADEAQQAREHELEDRRERLARVRKRLGALGFEPGGSVSGSIRLDLADWESLVKLAERALKNEVA